MAEKTVTLRVLFYQEGPCWVAQCIDHDLNAHGESIKQAQRAFEHVVISHIMVSVESGREPFTDATTVPPLFVQAYEHILAEKLERLPIHVPPGVDIPPAHMIGAIAAERRISGTF